MKNFRALLLPFVLCVGMVYALLSIGAVPAYACTPAECAVLQQHASQICQFTYGCLNGGTIVSCDSSGAELECFSCGGFFLNCAN